MSRKPFARSALGLAGGLAVALTGWEPQPTGRADPLVAPSLPEPIDLATPGPGAQGDPADGFRDRVLQQVNAIERFRSEGGEDEPRVPVGRAQALRRETLARAGGVDALRALEARADPEYLDQVFRGEIHGIPNETKAGISVAEMTLLGPVPYVEQLRREGRLEELSDLALGPVPSEASADATRINPRIEPLLATQGNR